MVITGVYEFHETYGVPLEDLLNYLQVRNMIVDWIDFYQAPIEDSYGFDHFKQIKINLEKVFKNE